jgi:hypothetical protein
MLTCVHIEILSLTQLIRFFGILHNADTSSLEFVTIDNRAYVITISIDEAPYWTIERMIELMSEQEFDALKHILIKFRAEYYEDCDIRDIIDRIGKRFGFDV